MIHRCSPPSPKIIVELGGHLLYSHIRSTEDPLLTGNGSRREHQLAMLRSCIYFMSQLEKTSHKDRSHKPRLSVFFVTFHIWKLQSPTLSNTPGKNGDLSSVTHGLVWSFDTHLTNSGTTSPPSSLPSAPPPAASSSPLALLTPTLARQSASNISPSSVVQTSFWSELNRARDYVGGRYKMLRNVFYLRIEGKRRIFVIVFSSGLKGWVCVFLIGE